jgi:hypothetical protein
VMDDIRGRTFRYVYCDDLGYDLGVLGMESESSCPIGEEGAIGPVGVIDALIEIFEEVWDPVSQSYVKPKSSDYHVISDPVFFEASTVQTVYIPECGVERIDSLECRYLGLEI